MISIKKLTIITVIVNIIAGASMLLMSIREETDLFLVPVFFSAMFFHNAARRVWNYKEMRDLFEFDEEGIPQVDDESLYENIPKEITYEDDGKDYRFIIKPEGAAPVTCYSNYPYTLLDKTKELVEVLDSDGKIHLENGIKIGVETHIMKEVN